MREISRKSWSVQFESPSHPQLVLSGLSSLRGKRQLLDVTLIANNQKFEAHRVVLASCSDYFRAMFTDEMKESQQKEIVLNGVTSEGIYHLLEYAYTSRLDLTLANIQDVLSAASHVQMMDVIEACSTYLEEQLDLDNCIDIATIAEMYSLWQLRKKVYHFICANLFKFSLTNDFQRLSSSQLEFILECDFPVDCSEYDVLTILLKWIQYNYNERKQHSSFLQHILFREIPKDKLIIHWSMIEQLVTDTNLIYRMFFRDVKKTTQTSSNVLVNTRGMENAIITVGGFNGICGITNEITYYLESEKKWKYLSRVPHLEQCNFGCAVHNNELYVVGGCFNQKPLEEDVHPFGFRFNPMSNNLNAWSTIAPMQKERCRFTLTAVDNYLYAIGGVGENNDFVFDEEFVHGEIYDPDSDLWQPIAPMPDHNRSQHAAVSWNNYIFISGGIDQGNVLSSMIKYDTLTDRWEHEESMLTRRADHTMILYDNKIFVCGGWYEDVNTGMRILVNTIDCYDIVNKSWSIMTYIPTPRYHAGIVNKGPILYIIGGFLSDITFFDRASGIIEAFNISTCTWESLDNYPQDIWEHSCCTLFVPKYRDDMEVITDKL